ncbi:hypothetical protein GQ53DRAFT_803372 [Thozetella sp. PMI_491]|nr:hypothetical protein GQ53DRAFT_803372 [Thozetella sp. PMI_491]
MITRWDAVLAALLCCWCRLVLGQNDTEKLPTFGDTVQVLGAMERTDQDFRDGLALDLFSPKNRTLVVQQNTNPLPGHFVTGTTGEPFVALSNYSYIIKMNETARDLIAKIEIPYDVDMLNRMGVQEANTYVGTLAADKMSWVIDDSKRNVHRSENNTRIIKMTSLDGEYMLLGRQVVDVTNIFVQYGQGATRTVNITAGGRQDAEFVDGLRFSTLAKEDVRMNVDLTNGVAAGTLPNGMRSLNSFAWTINSSNPSISMEATMRVPVNKAMLEDLLPEEQERGAQLLVAKRALNSSSTTMFQVLDKETQSVGERGDSITVRNVQQVDGQYIVLVAPGNAMY